MVDISSKYGKITERTQKHSRKKKGTKMYKRKTRDRWDIETNCGYGWEVECSEYTRKEAKEQLRCYRENACGRFCVRLTKHREPIEEGGAT